MYIHIIYIYIYIYVYIFVGLRDHSSGLWTPFRQVVLDKRLPPELLRGRVDELEDRRVALLPRLL